MNVATNLNKKERRNKGITLIALVITIIVLLILAGISIAMLTGDNGILKKATTAKEETTMEQAYEEIKIVLNEWQIEKIKTNKTFEEFLDVKIESKEIDGYEKLDNGNIEIYRNGYYIVVDSNSNIIEGIQKIGPRVVISNIKITLEDETEPEDYSQTIGTPLRIEFNANIEGGEILSIVPELIYTTDGNEMEKEFTIVGKVNGEEYTKKTKISVARKYIQSYESLEKAIIDITKDEYKKV